MELQSQYRGLGAEIDALVVTNADDGKIQAVWFSFWETLPRRGWDVPDLGERDGKEDGRAKQNTSRMNNSLCRI